MNPAEGNFLSNPDFWRLPRENRRKPEGARARRARACRRDGTVPRFRHADVGTRPIHQRAV